MIEEFCNWLSTTSGSVSLHESTYMWPAIESVHVLTLGLFVGFSVILDLRLVGLSFKHVRVSAIADALLPWTTAAFVIMAVSGVLIFYANPLHFYHNVFFRLKMIMLVLAGLNAWRFHGGIWRSVERWDLNRVTPTAARLAGAASLVLWVAIIFAGRLIAYNWFDCENTTIAFIRTASGCS
jgi:hypothetical protein